jgi:hypothetical protein
MKNRLSLAAAVLVTSLPLFAQDTTGTWSSSVPDSTATLEASAVPPVANEGSLNCNRKVIPVKFTLEDTDLMLSSDTSDTDTTNDFSFLSFDPTDALTVSDLTNLTAVYEVAEGNCGGGSLRWEIDTTAGNVFVYYGAAPAFTDCSGAEGQSGVNLLSLDDARVDSSQVYAGTQVNTWDAFVAANPDLVVEDVNLVADGGWSQADGVQAFTISSATVNDNMFTGDDAACDLPDATIRLTGANGETIPTQSIQGGDDSFREDDCQYIYNLVNPGPGTYTVDILVDGEVIGSSTLTVACNGKGRSSRK